MATPTSITITGTVKISGDTVAGRLVFAGPFLEDGTPVIVRDGASGDVLIGEERTVVVGSDGVVATALPATDDPAFSPTGWVWQVRPHFPGWNEPFNCAIPYDAPGGALDLSELGEPPPDGTAQLYALVGHTHEGGGGGGNIDPAATVVSETAYGQSSSAGNAVTYSRGNHTHGTPALPTPGAIGAATTGHTHTGIYDPAGSAAAALSTANGNLTAHEADTTAIHGIANTANLIVEGDARLTNNRTPTSHASTHGSAGSDAVSLNGSQITAGTVGLARLPTGTSGTTVALGDAPAAAVTAHVGVADPHTQYSSIYYWNGSSYDLVTGANVYVGGTGPASPTNGDLLFAS